MVGSEIRGITLYDYLKGRELRYPISSLILMNAIEMVTVLNDLFYRFGEYRNINSGYRPPAINKLVPNPKQHSLHLTCQAVDVEDRDGKLKAFCTEAILVEFDLYMEDPIDTPVHCHLQTVAPPSGKRIFRAG